MVVWHLGWGMQLTPPGAFRLAHRVRAKAPGLYPPNALNIPDTVQRPHWEPQRAQELGPPGPYDHGGMRETWLCHIITDWMGDDGWLWKLRCETTTPGTAVVLLPTRERPRVELPEPPAPGLDGMVAHELRRFDVAE